MINGNLVLRVFKVICVVLALVVSMNAGASLFGHTESWTESALLRDGRTIEVKREVEFVMKTSGELAQMFRSWPTTYGLKFKHPDTQKTIKWQGEPHFQPVLLDFVNGVPYLVVYGKPDQINMKKYGCLDIPYIFLRYDEKNQVWIPLQREQIPNKLKDANLAPSYDGTYMPQNGSHPSRHIVEYMIRSAESHSGGFFQSKIPVDFDSWQYRGKQRYKNERTRNDCRPARENPPEIALPPAQKLTLEILETKDYTPEWIIKHADWSRLTFDKERSGYCSTLFKPANPDDPLMDGREAFVKDATGQKRVPFQRFAAPIGNRICEGGYIWFFDYVAEPGRMVLTKFSTGGDFIYRISFERPEDPSGFLGVIMSPTFKLKDGYLFFDWWNQQQFVQDRRVKRTLKVRLREPELSLPVIQKKKM